MVFFPCYFNTYVIFASFLGKVSTRDQSKSGSLYKQVTLACPNFICFEDNMCVDLCELDVRPQRKVTELLIVDYFVYVINFQRPAD